MKNIFHMPRIQKHHLYILSGLLISGIAFSIVQLVTANPDKPNPGHSWNQLECDNNLCVNTVNGRVGVGTINPSSVLSFKMGAGTGQAQAIGRVYINAQDVVVSDTGAETVMYSYTLPANSLNENGKAIRIKAWGYFHSGFFESLIIRMGGVPVAVLSSGLGNAVLLEDLVVRTSPNTLKSFYNTLDPMQVWSEPSGSQTRVGVSSLLNINWSVDNLIEFIGIRAVGAGASIMGQGMIIEYIN